MSQSLTDRPSVITVANTDEIILSVKFSWEIFFFQHASPSIILSVFWFFLFLTELATENEITDDQNFDGRVPSVWPSRNILPMKCVPYTDGMSLSVKLFIGVVFF